MGMFDEWTEVDEEFDRWCDGPHEIVVDCLPGPPYDIRDLKNEVCYSTVLDAPET